MSPAPSRSLHFMIHLGWGVHVCFRRGPETINQGGTKRDDNDPENWPFTKDFNFPKEELSLSSSVCFSASTYLFNKLFALVFTLCLLILIHSWLGRQGLGALALTVGSCGPALRTSGLGNQGLASSYCSLQAAAYCCTCLKSFPE